jgi:hypothetical protein
VLYIFHAICIFIWLLGVIKNGKYSWHAIINTYFIFLLVVDVPEVFFSHYLGFYRFLIHLLFDFNKDDQLGLIFSDGFILPVFSIIVCHYATQIKNHWRLTFIFTLLQGILEWIYLRLGYLLYHKWNLWLSVTLYFIGIRLSTEYASRLMRYNPPVSYSLRIAAATYSVTVWVGAVLGGLLIRLYEWTPHLFTLQSAEDRFPDVSISWVLALLSAIIVPKIPLKYRPIVFMIFSALATAFCYFAYGHGWLIYHRWNHLLTALRWFIPFIVIMWFDHWESTYAKDP